MKSSSILLLTGASVALASPVLDIIVETDVYYYTVTQEVTTVETIPAEAPVEAPTVPVENKFNVATTSTFATLFTPAPVVTVTVDATEAAPTPEAPVAAPQAPAPAAQAPAPAPEAPAPAPEAPAPAPQAPANNAEVASSAAEAPSTASPTDFAGTATYHHNIHRTNNSAPSMTYDHTYASYAAQVAASCHFAHDLTPGGGGYGQNIAMYASTDADSMTGELAIAQAITEMWYDGEIDLYPSNAYGSANPDMSNFEGWGHYSQVVWVGSTKVGCAAQYCAPGSMEPGMGAWYSVCNYYPAGNVDGEYGKNVLAPVGAAPVNVKVVA